MMIERLNKDDPIVAYIEGVVGVCPATSFEQHSLWAQYHDQLAWDWVQITHGYGVTVGYVVDGALDPMPVHISLSTVIVNGSKILFYNPTSAVVDWRMVDEWIELNVPDTAYYGNRARINRSDPMNFCNLFPRETVSG
jgi:hypothetical protein